MTSIQYLQQFEGSPQVSITVNVNRRAITVLLMNSKYTILHDSRFANPKLCELFIYLFIYLFICLFIYLFNRHEN